MEKSLMFGSEIESALADSIQPKGIVFIFGIAGVEGTKVNVQHVYQAFHGKFNFAVLIEENLTCKDLARYIKAAAEYKYPRSCKSRVFYFAGHGEIDKNRQPFFHAIGTEEMKTLSVQRHILAPFRSDKCIRNYDNMIFLFDCSLTMVDHGKYDPNAAPFAFDIPPQCLVAFATSPGKKSYGDTLNGGAWTSRLCGNLEKLRTGDTLTSALDATNDAVMKNSESTQPPQYHSCTGPIYLKGSYASELDKLFQAFKSCKTDLLHLLRDDDDTLISLTAVLCSEDIIKESVKSSVFQKKGWNGSTVLLDELEKSCNAKPDNIRLVLKNMEDESLLSSLVKKIREDAASKSKFDRKTYAELLASLNEQEEEIKALTKVQELINRNLTAATGNTH